MKWVVFIISNDMAFRFITIRVYLMDLGGFNHFKEIFLPSFWGNVTWDPSLYEPPKIKREKSAPAILQVTFFGWFSRWWFPIFFIFTPIWGRFPIWLIFFRWVGSTTNQFSSWPGKPGIAKNGCFLKWRFYHPPIASWSCVVDVSDCPFAGWMLLES